MRLIITEKASVAASISSALGMAETKKHDGYIEAGSNTVTWCVGHLIEMQSPQLTVRNIKNGTSRSFRSYRRNTDMM